jgi:hypothetical protein
MLYTDAGRTIGEVELDKSRHFYYLTSLCPFRLVDPFGLNGDRLENMLWTRFNSVEWLLVALFVTKSFGFTNTKPAFSLAVVSSKSRIFMVDPSLLDPNLIDVTIAVVSAAAGAASQLPRIQELEKEVNEARDALTLASIRMTCFIRCVDWHPLHSS